MKAIHLSLVALAVSAALSQTAVAAMVEDQAQSNGFMEDSHLNVLLRNQYFNRDGKKGITDKRDWTQGAIARYESGFTQGTVGVGVDAWGHMGLKLDGQSRYSGFGNLPVDRHGSRKAVMRPPEAASSCGPARPS